MDGPYTGPYFHRSGALVSVVARLVAPYSQALLDNAYGFGFRFFPYAEDRRDRMQLRLSTISAAAFVANFRSIWRGEYDDLTTTFDYFVDDITIEMDPPTAFQIGGDVAGERGRVRVRLTEPIRIADFYAPPRG